MRLYRTSTRTPIPDNGPLILAIRKLINPTEAMMVSKLFLCPIVMFLALVKVSFSKTAPSSAPMLLRFARLYAAQLFGSDCLWPLRVYLGKSYAENGTRP